MSVLEEVLADLAEECAVLDALLASLPEEAWLAPTPAQGWDVRDTTHLADTDDLAYDCVTGGSRDLLREAAEAGGGEAFTAAQVRKGRGLRPPEVLAWWRASAARLREALCTADPARRIPWGPNRLSPASFATARLMETWAHGLDCFAAAGVQPVDTDRLRHVAFLGWRALPYALSRHGLKLSGPVRLELVAPSGTAWVFGPEDAPTVVRGAASDWCRVAARRDRAGEAGRLQASGPDAGHVLRYAQAYL